MTDHEDAQVQALLDRWVAAEVAADLEVLDAITDPTFTLVGPAGFVLDKVQWLDRYRSGDLVTLTLTLDQTAVRVYERSAVSVGVQTQQATYAGHDAAGAFRTTHMMISVGDSWRLVGQHVSPITGRR